MDARDFSTVTELPGRTIGRDPRPRDLDLRRAGALAAVTFLDQQGRVRAAVHGPEASYRPAGDEGFIRVEARDRAGGRVWSQPFWIEKEGRGA